MQIYLVQHGAAVSKDVDPERPLSGRGRADVEELSVFLARRGAMVARAVHSGKTRARQTAELLCARLAPGIEPEQMEGMAPKDPSDALVRRLNETTVELLAAGHQPFMGRCVSRLLTGSEEGMAVGLRPGSIVCLDRDEDGGWSLAWMLRPELLHY